MLNSVLYNYIHKPLAFLTKDFKVAASYKLNFVMQFFAVFFNSSLFFMVSQLVGSANVPALSPYGGDYFTFLLIGIAVTDYFTVATTSFASEIRYSQVEGTLESLLVTPTSLTTIILSSFLYRLLYTSMRIILYFFIGIVIFGIQLQLTSPIPLFITFSLLLLTFIGIGLISVAFIIVLKQGSPVSYLISISSSLLGGMLYPITVLPDWLQSIAVLLPITHGLEAIRQILINGAGFSDISSQLTILALFSVLLLATGIWAINYGVKLAKKDGSLLHY